MAPSTEVFVDHDGDGYVDSDDCDDERADVHPNAIEWCNGLDEDCDGLIDADAVDEISWHPDADQDGFGDWWTEKRACIAPSAWLSDGSDCADSDPTVFPGQGEVTLELTSGVQEDLSDLFDAGTSDAPTVYAIESEGVLNFCAKTWYARIQVYASARIGSSGLEVATLSGGGVGPVVEVSPALSLSLYRIRLEDGESVDGGLLYQTDGTLDVAEVGFYGGAARESGGLAFLRNVDSSIVDSTFRLGHAGTASDGYADGKGGALYLEGGTAEITGSYFDQSYARFGAAIYSDTELVLLGSTLFDNVASLRLGDPGMGALFAKQDATIVATAVYGNSSFGYSALAVDSGAEVTAACSGEGFYDNHGESAAWVSGVLISEDCDWEGNTGGADVTVEDVGHYTYGSTGVSFRCEGGMGCF